MKILPVYPEFPPSFWSLRYAVSMLGKKASMPPLGLVTILSMFPEDKFEIQKVIDLNTTRLKDSQIQNCDLILTSSMLVQNKSLDEVIERAHFFGKKVVAGGPYPTSYSERVKADYLVLGEAELTLPEFIKDLVDGKAKRIYDEKDARKRSLLINLTKEGKPELDRTPVPRWDLLDLRNYASLAIQYSRGCPFDCEFCDITHLFGHVPRTKNPEQMLRELDAIYDASWRGAVFMVDDNFIGNKENAREFLPQLEQWQIKHRYPFSLFTEASMDLALPVNRTILEGMVKAGFDTVFLGIESLDEDVLKGMHKKQNIMQATPLEKVETTQKAGLKVQGGFIIGGDGEKPDIFDNLFRFVQEAGIVTPMPGLLGALKGTKLYDRLEKENRLRFIGSGNNTHDLEFNFEPQLNEKFLLEGYSQLLRRLFDSKNYYERCRVQDSMLGMHKSENRMTLAGFRAFANIMYQNLIKKPDSEFIKYAYDTLRKNPRNFPEAIANAIRLHHFQTITNATVSVDGYRKRVEELYGLFMNHVNELKGSAEERYKRFIQIQGGIERKAAKMCRRIHKDFRDNATAYLDNLRGKISDLRTSYFPS